MQAARGHVRSGDFADAVFGSRAAEGFCGGVKQPLRRANKAVVCREISTARKYRVGTTPRAGAGAQAAAAGNLARRAFHLGASFLTRIFELRPLCSYFSRRGGRQVFGGAFDESALGLEIGEGLGGKRDQLAQAQFPRLGFDKTRSTSGQCPGSRARD